MSPPISLNEGRFITNSTLAYALVVMLADTARIPTDGWQAIVLGPMSEIGVVTLVPRFSLTLRRLYERDLQGRHCGSDIYMAPGLSSAFGRHAPVGAIVFTDAGRNEGLEEYEEIGTQGAEVGGGLGG